MIAVIAAIGALVGACGQAAPDGPGTLEELSISYPTRGTFPMYAYIAQDQGFFTAEGLRLTQYGNEGNNVTTRVVSGAVDLGFGSVNAPLAVAKQGKQALVGRAVGGGGTGGGMVGAPGHTDTLDALKALPACRIGALPSGTSATGYATRYNATLGTRCDIVPMTSPASLLAALASGRVDAVVTAMANLENAVREGKATRLIDPSREEDRLRYVTPPTVDAVEFGLYDNLERKKGALAKYIKGIARARDYAKGFSDQQIAEILHKFPDYQDRSIGDLTSEISQTRPLLGLGSSVDGAITEQQWADTLKALSAWGITGYDPADPTYAYAKNVDTSYFAR